MRAVIQRVKQAAVTVSGETVGAIGPGLVVLVGIARDDAPEDAAYLVDKATNMRLFPDDQGRFDRSALDLGYELLVVSQFTLYGDMRRGRRPSFTEAAPPESASGKFANVVERFRATGLGIETGRFQEMMEVSLVNDGPVTIWIDTAERHTIRRA